MPEWLESLHQIPLETVGVDAIEIVSAKILAVALVLLQVIANDYDPVSSRRVNESHVLSSKRKLGRFASVRQPRCVCPGRSATNVPICPAACTRSPFFGMRFFSLGHAERSDQLLLDGSVALAKKHGDSIPYTAVCGSLHYL